VEITMTKTTTPWLASSCADSAAVTGARIIAAPAVWHGTPGITAGSAAKLRQERTAQFQARPGAGVLVSGTTTDMVLGYAAFGRRPAVDPLTTSITNGVVQGPPPWRHPVIT
jgi:hypothetical protein